MKPPIPPHWLALRADCEKKAGLGPYIWDRGPGGRLMRDGDMPQRRAAVFLALKEAGLPETAIATVCGVNRHVVRWALHGSEKPALAAAPAPAPARLALASAREHILLCSIRDQFRLFAAFEEPEHIDAILELLNAAELAEDKTWVRPKVLGKSPRPAVAALLTGDAA